MNKACRIERAHVNMKGVWVHGPLLGCMRVQAELSGHVYARVIDLARSVGIQTIHVCVAMSVESDF